MIPFLDLSCFKALEEDVDSVFRDRSELSKIYHLNLSETPGLIKYRDMFKVRCLTGFRFSDYSTLNRNQLKNGMLHLQHNLVKSKGGFVGLLFHVFFFKITIVFLYLRYSEHFHAEAVLRISPTKI